MKVITGKGKFLRELVYNIKHKESFNLESFFDVNKCIFFPETNLDIDEQSKYISELNNNDVIIFTLSPWIISDIEEKNVLIVIKEQDKFYLEEINFNTFGASVNKIHMNLFQRKSTISELALKRINNLSNDLDNNILFDFNEVDLELGESVEKIILFKKFFSSTENSSLSQKIKKIIIGDK